MFPSLVVTSFSGLLIPEFARYRAKKDWKKAVKVIKIILLFTTIFSIILTLFFILFSRKISLYFYNLLDCDIYIKIFSLLTTFMYLDIVIDSILKGLNAQVSVMVINILDLAITAIVIYFLVPIFGIPGLIISIFISEIFNFILSAIKLYTLTHKEAKNV